MLLGQLGANDIIAQETWLLMILYFSFSILCVIIALNVFIAIVSMAYEEAIEAVPDDHINNAVHMLVCKIRGTKYKDHTICDEGEQLRRATGPVRYAPCDAGTQTDAQERRSPSSDVEVLRCARPDTDSLVTPMPSARRTGSMDGAGDPKEQTK